MKIVLLVVLVGLVGLCSSARRRPYYRDQDPFYPGISNRNYFPPGRPGRPGNPGRPGPRPAQQCLEQYNCGNQGYGGQYYNQVECIDANLVCDGNDDCSNGADEYNCEFQSIRCKPGEYTCTSRNRCIDVKSVCDNHNDCPDNDDENDCSGGCKCPADNYLCNDDSTCVNIGLVCDGTNHCPGGDDESSCPSSCFT